MSAPSISGCIVVPGAQRHDGAMVGPCIDAAAGEEPDKSGKCVRLKATNSCYVNPEKLVPLPDVLNNLQTAAETVMFAPVEFENAVVEAWNESLEHMLTSTGTPPPQLKKVTKMKQDEYVVIDGHTNVPVPQIKRNEERQYHVPEATYNKLPEKVKETFTPLPPNQVLSHRPEKDIWRWITFPWELADVKIGTAAMKRIEVIIPMHLLPNSTKIEEFLAALKHELIEFNGATNMAWFVSAENDVVHEAKMYNAEVHFNRARAKTETAPHFPVFTISNPSKADPNTPVLPKTCLWVSYPQSYSSVFSDTTHRFHFLSNVQAGVRGCQYACLDTGVYAILENERFENVTRACLRVRDVVQTAILFTHHKYRTTFDEKLKGILHLGNDPFKNTVTVKVHTAYPEIDKIHKKLLGLILPSISNITVSSVATNTKHAIPVLLDAGIGTDDDESDVVTTRDKAAIVIAVPPTDDLTKAYAKVNEDAQKLSESVFQTQITVREAKFQLVNTLIGKESNEADIQMLIMAWNYYISQLRYSVVFPAQKRLLRLPASDLKDITHEEVMSKFAAHQTETFDLRPAAMDLLKEAPLRMVMKRKFNLFDRMMWIDVINALKNATPNRPTKMIAGS
jgi:hypothetical protein